MKKILCVFLFFLLSKSLVASKTEIKYSNKELSSLAKAWGFLKYYHPTVSQGKLNWDSLLISSLSTRNKMTVSQAVQTWLNIANGEKALLNKPVLQEELKDIDGRNLNFLWINNDSFLSSAQKNIFLTLTKTPTPVGTYYSLGKTNRYSIDNEKIYPDDSVAYRLLGLFRFWNVIEYFYPYKYAIGRPWDDVLLKYIPLTIVANDELSKVKLISLLAASIEDTHAEIRPSVNYTVFGSLGAPFNFKVVDNIVVITKIVDSAACAKSKLAIGDLITNVNGKSITKLMAINGKYLAASNESVKIRDAYYHLFSGDEQFMEIEGEKKTGSPYKVSVSRIKRQYDNEWDKEGNPENKLTYYDYHNKKLVYSQILSGNIGYIDRSLIESKEVDSIFKSMLKTKGLILDLRGYSSSSAFLGAFDYLLPNPTQYGKVKCVDFNKPGNLYTINYILGTKTFKILTIGKNNPEYYKGKLILLINSSTQSAEEMWAMMCQTIPGAITIGTQTAGADGNKTQVRLFGQYTVAMSGIGIYYPDGRETQRIGIVPDIEVKLSLKDIQEQRDILVEKAIEVINRAN